MKIKVRHLFVITLMVFVLVGPILDLFTGYFQLVPSQSSAITPGILYRGIFLTPIFVILTLQAKTPSRSAFFYFINIFVLAIFIQLLVGLQVDLFGSVSRIIKILFPILGLGALIYLDKKVNKSIIREDLLWLAGGLYGLMVVLSVVLFYLLGLAVPTYSLQSFSSKALYDGQNAVGLVMTMSLPLILNYVYAYRKQKLFFALILSGLYLLGAILLSSRAAIIGVVLGVALFQIYIFVNRKFYMRPSNFLIYLIAIAGLLLIGFIVYQYWISHDIAYTMRKFNLLIAGEFRSRVPDGLKQISEFSLLEHLFGVGEAGFALTENDLVDIYGKFGLLTLIPLLLFFFFYYLRIWWVTLKRKEISTFCLLLSFTFYIGHASVAGHGFATAQVNNLMMLIYYLAYREINKNNHITEHQKTVSKLSGQETAVSTR